MAKTTPTEKTTEPKKWVSELLLSEREFLSPWHYKDDDGIHEAGSTAAFVVTTRRHGFEADSGPSRVSTYVSVEVNDGSKGVELYFDNRSVRELTLLIKALTRARNKLVEGNDADPAAEPLF